MACSPEPAQSGLPSPSDDETSSSGTPNPSTSTTGDEATTSSSGAADSSSDTIPDWLEPDVPGEPGDCWFGESCPGGDKCVPRSAVDERMVWSVCAPVVRDPVPLGGDCSLFPTVEDMPVDDCDAETYCVVTDHELQTGTCMRVCGIEDGLAGPPPDPTVCTKAQVCQPTGPVIHVCSDACDPLSPSCAEGFGCYAVSEGAVCMPSGATSIGEGCFAPNECVPGASCLSGDVLPACDSAGCCAPLCDTSQPDECDAALPGTACTAFDVPGLEGLGACAPP